MFSYPVNILSSSELEEPCLLDLGKLCSENPEKGAEVDCLQEHYDKLTEDCQQAVARVTEREADDIGWCVRWLSGNSVTEAMRFIIIYQPPTLSS